MLKRTARNRDIIVGAATLMIAAQLAFRAWAIYPSWFYTDDYRLMVDAQRRRLSLNYLFTPFDSQIMPGGRLLVWLVTHAGTTQWALAATLTLALQLLTSVACAIMLITLFGRRTAVLALLAIYLTSALVLPGFMWWAAALNQMPLQLAFFLAVAAWVAYLRSRRKRWLAVTLAALLFGGLFYIKVLLVVFVLLHLMLAYFAHGSFVGRIRQSLRARWAAALAIGVPSVLLAVVYVSAVNQPFESKPDRFRLAGEVADTMLGVTLPTGAVGGPWHWWNTSPPVVLALPPALAVNLTWALVALVVAYSILRRRRAGRGWFLLAWYSIAAYVLLATSRGQLYGRLAGQEPRYLTDVVPVIVLTLGLVFLRLRWAEEPAVPRRPAVLVRSVPQWCVVALTLAIVLGGIASSVQYVGYWHHHNAGRDYVKNIQGDLRAFGSVDLPVQAVPVDVMPDYTSPKNTTDVFVPLIAQGARFPLVSDNLHVIDPRGRVHPAAMGSGMTSLEGPEPGCGWRIQDDWVRVPLDGGTFDFGWWIKIGFLSSGPGVLEVRAGRSLRSAPARRGLGTVFVFAEGVFSSVELRVADPDINICVDKVQVGQPIPESGD